MALPELRLASAIVPSTVVGARGIGRNDYLVDYEDGGIALSDSSQGLLYQVWTARVEGGQVYLSAEEVPEDVYYQGGENITEVSLTFDQNMRVTMAIVEGGEPYLIWFNSQVGTEVKTHYPGIKNPRVILDDKRKWQSSTSDVLFFYIKQSDGTLCMRQQRDRYEVEYVLATGLKELYNVGFSSSLRILFSADANRSLAFVDAELIAS